MVKLEMNYTEKRHFAYRKVCPICGNKINDWDDIQYIRFQYGRIRMYTFFHTACLVKHNFGEEGQ